MLLDGPIQICSTVFMASGTFDMTVVAACHKGTETAQGALRP